MNRVEASIKLIVDLLAKNAEALAKFQEIDQKGNSLKLDLELFVGFQEVKSLAVAMELITTEEGQSIYVALGSSPDHFNRQPLAVRYVLIKHFMQLMEWKIAGAKPPRKQAV